MEIKERLQKLMHFIAGIVVILHGLEHMDTGGAVLFYLVIGIIMLTIAFFHENIDKYYPKIAGSFYLMEALVMVFIAFEYWDYNKKYLPIIYMLAAAGYSISGYIFMTRKVKIRKTKK